MFANKQTTHRMYSLKVKLQLEIYFQRIQLRLSIQRTEMSENADFRFWKRLNEINKTILRKSKKPVHIYQNYNRRN